MGILGDLEKTIVYSTSPLEQLIAAAELHHAFSFDSVLDREKLDYEPRCSASCATCKTLWVGSKAGEILRLRFASGELEPVKQTLERGVRALLHVHRLDQLVVGLDSGHLVALDSTRFDVVGSLALATLAESSPFATAPYAAGIEGVKVDDYKDPERFRRGITAMLELPVDSKATEVVDIVVATRSPTLLVVRLRRNELEIRAQHPLPGWTRCLAITGPAGNEILVCATRSGEFLEWSCRAMREDRHARPVRTETSLLPTAIAKPSGQDSALLVGASDGLYVRRRSPIQRDDDANRVKPGRDERFIHVPATRSAVLSLATVTIQTVDRIEGMPGESSPVTSKDYVALGLEDGRLRVFEEQALLGLLDGEDALNARDFTVDLGDAVLALGILPAEEPATCFLLAALRDHRLRLFRVRSRPALLHQLHGLWCGEMAAGDPARTRELEALWGRLPVAISEPALVELLDREAKLRENAGPKHEQALRYFLADEILQRWAAALPDRRELLVQRACAIARGADRKVLYRLSATMGRIAHSDANALIQISMACLVAMPEDDARRWRAFLASHLKHLHAGARLISDREQVSRLQHWARFVRKYLFLGETFADKRFGIARLMRRNQETRKYLDALIYAAQLEQQRFDLTWSTVVRRQEDGRAQDIARVELFDDTAIVITTSAEIVFFDVDGGVPLPIVDETGRRDSRLRILAKDQDAGFMRTRASRAIRKQGSQIHLAISWAGGDALEPSQLRVAIFELRIPEPRVNVKPRISDTADAEPHEAGRTDQTPERRVRVERVYTARSELRHPTDVQIHGLDGLCGKGSAGFIGKNAFLVGLDSSESPLALLLQQPGHDAWVLSLLRMSPRHTAHSVGPPVISTPVRAVAALELVDEPGKYLGAAGAADGTLRFVAFDRSGEIYAIDAAPTLLVYPINDIALAPHKGEYNYVCYAATEAGVSLCLLVHLDCKAKRINVQQLWRDLHGSAVVAVRPTRRPEPGSAPPGESSPPPQEALLYQEDVVFVVSAAGSLSIYRAEHALAKRPRSANRDDPDVILDPGELDTRLSEASNYYFEGMRFDRIALPEGLRSWAIRRTRSGFLAAYPGGKLLFGELHGPHESRSHQDLKATIDNLYTQVITAQRFFGNDRATEEQKLEICAMIRIGRGALRSYVLRKQLEREPWATLDERKLEELLTRYLRDLRPDVIDERYRIKIMLEIVSSRVLDRHPDAILEDCRKATDDRFATRARVATVVEQLADHLMAEAAQAQPGPVRVRMAIMNALLRLNVFRHAALEFNDKRIRLALEKVLTACLRDDDKIVRVEVLRGVGIVLRNISVLLERADDDIHREALRRNFLPEGLDSIQWLVSTIIDNHARYRGLAEHVMLSTPWSYISVLVSVFRLFRGMTLELCEQISRKGLSDSLELVTERLRGDRFESTRVRIRELWMLPWLREQARAQAVRPDLRRMPHRQAADELRHHDEQGGSTGSCSRTRPPPGLSPPGPVLAGGRRGGYPACPAALPQGRRSTAPCGQPRGDTEHPEELHRDRARQPRGSRDATRRAPGPDHRRSARRSRTAGCRAARTRARHRTLEGGPGAEDLGHGRRRGRIPTRPRAGGAQLRSGVRGRRSQPRRQDPALPAGRQATSRILCGRALESRACRPLSRLVRRCPRARSDAWPCGHGPLSRREGVRRVAPGRAASDHRPTRRDPARPRPAPPPRRKPGARRPQRQKRVRRWHRRRAQVPPRRPAGGGGAVIARDRGSRDSPPVETRTGRSDPRALERHALVDAVRPLGTHRHETTTGPQPADAGHAGSRARKAPDAGN